MISFVVPLDANVGQVKAAIAAAVEGAGKLEGPLAIQVAVKCPMPAEWDQRQRNRGWTGEEAPLHTWDLVFIHRMLVDCLIAAAKIEREQVCVLSMVKKYSNGPGVEVRLFRAEL